MTRTEAIKQLAAAERVLGANNAMVRWTDANVAALRELGAATKRVEMDGRVHEHVELTISGLLVWATRMVASEGAGTMAKETSE